MLIEEVCVFDEKFNFKKNIPIDESCKDTAKEVQKYLKKKLSYQKLSETAKDIMFILEDEITFLFTTALLFIGSDKKVISEYTGLDEKSIECFREIFFRVNYLRGKIARIGFFKRLIVSDDLQKQNLGVILKAAHTFGEEYIKWKFGLNENSIDPNKIVVNTFKDMYFKYMEESYRLSENATLDHIKAGKQIISAALDMQKAAAIGNGSTEDEIKQYLLQLQEEVKNNSWSMELEVVDINEFNNNKEQE